MSDLSIKAWVTQEQAAFDNYDEFLATRVEEGICKTITEKMSRDLSKNGKTEVVLPWGTYSAEIKSSGETGNITPSFVPSKGFLKMLNSDMDAAAMDREYQDEFDPEFIELFHNYLMYGDFDPSKADAAKKKGIKLKPIEIEYLINSYARVLASIGKEKQRDGKSYRLDIDNVYSHGTFIFEYEDDEIKVKFVAGKSFKQDLKNDAAVVEATA